MTKQHTDNLSKEDQAKGRSALERLADTIEAGEYCPSQPVRIFRGMTKTKLARLLNYYVQTGNLTLSAKKAKLSLNLCYFYIRSDPEFGELFDAAKGVALLGLETEAYRRAVHGVLEPVYQKGELVGHIRKYDTQLLIFLMKNLMRDRFGDKVDITQRHDFSNAREEVEKALKRIVGRRKETEE